MKFKTSLFLIGLGLIWHPFSAQAAGEAFLSILACLAEDQRPEIAVYRKWFPMQLAGPIKNVLPPDVKVSNLSAHIGLEVPAVVRDTVYGGVLRFRLEGVPGRAFTYKADVTCQFFDNTETQKIKVSACAYVSYWDDGYPAKREAALGLHRLAKGFSVEYSDLDGMDNPTLHVGLVGPPDAAAFATDLGTTNWNETTSPTTTESETHTDNCTQRSE